MAKLTVSASQRFVEGFDNHPIFIGVDVHKRSYSVAILRPDGLIHDWTTPADPAQLANLIASLPARIGAVAHESGPTGFGFARMLQALGVPVIVAAPSRIPRPVAATNKTDSLDCRKLAEYAATGLLRPIAIPSEQEEAARALVRRRHQTTDGLRKVKQRIRGLLLVTGVDEPSGIDHWGKATLDALRKITMKPEATEVLHSLLRELEFLSEEQQRLDERIKEHCRRRGEEGRIQALKAIPGVGPVVAHSFAAEIFNPHRFQRQEEVTAYLGLAPVVRQSGEKQGKGRLRPVGQKRLRSLLIEAAWIWKQKDEEARAFYNRILGRCGVPQKAIAALARKLAVLLWRRSLAATAA